MDLFEPGTRIAIKDASVSRVIRLAFVITEDWYFVLHWLPIARVARDMGFDVTIITRFSTFRALIAAERLNTVDWESARATLNPRRAIGAMRALRSILRREKIDIVHNISLQCTVIGSMAAALSPAGCTINSINGFGHLAAGGRRNRAILGMMLSFIRLSSRYDPDTTFTIVPNEHDLSVLVKNSKLDTNVMLIPGIGIDTARLTPQPDDPTVVTVAFVGRLVREKGLFTFVEAARLVREHYPETRFIVAGGLDADSPGAVSEEQVQSWVRDGSVEWLGFVKDILEVWQRAQIAVLPSYYGEGLPTSLLEAASCGRSMVTTDVTGCRDVVRNNVDGFLVPARDPVVLAGAITELVGNRDLRVKFGAAARQRVEDVFSTDAVYRQFRSVYLRAKNATVIGR